MARAVSAVILILSVGCTYGPADIPALEAEAAIQRAAGNEQGAWALEGIVLGLERKHGIVSTAPFEQTLPFSPAQPPAVDPHPARFTRENLDQLELGVAEAKIRALFGPPDELAMMRCETEARTPAQRKTLGYRNDSGLRNTFTFQSSDGMWMLTGFDVRWME